MQTDAFFAVEPGDLLGIFFQGLKGDHLVLGEEDTLALISLLFRESVGDILEDALGLDLAWGVELDGAL